MLKYEVKLIRDHHITYSRHGEYHRVNSHASMYTNGLIFSYQYGNSLGHEYAEI